jgi:hypothetical protein
LRGAVVVAPRRFHSGPSCAQIATYLAHLAECKSLWGPFLLVVPAAYVRLWTWTLQWACPLLVTMPYCGEGRDRANMKR